MLISPLAPEANSQAVIVDEDADGGNDHHGLAGDRGGSPNRWMASHPMAPTATRRNTALNRGCQIEDPFIP